MLSCNGCKNRNTYASRGCVEWDRYESNTLMNPTLAIDIDKEMKMLAKAGLNNLFGVKNAERKTDMRIKKVYFNDPVTVVLWEDGTKTIVRAGEDDIYDPEKGLAMAIAKKALGNDGNYYEVFKKWLPEEDAPRTRIRASAIKLTKDGSFSAAIDFQDTDGLCDECIEYIAENIVDRLANVNPSLKSSTMTTEKEILLSPEELAKKLGVTKATIQKQCREGLHPGAVKVGGKWQIPYTEN